MSISSFFCGDLADHLKIGTNFEVYTKECIPGVDQPKMLIPDTAAASGSYKDTDAIQIHRGQATVTITNALVGGYDNAIEPRIEEILNIQSTFCVGDKIKLHIGSDAAAPSLALDVLKNLSKADQAVAVLGKEIYLLQHRGLKHTRESSPSDQQPSKHPHTDTTER